MSTPLESRMSDEPQAIVPVRQQTVDFYGDTLQAAQGADERVYVPVRPICEALGVDWPGQRRRILRDPALAGTLALVLLSTSGGDQEMLCLPLKLLPGWLFGLTISK